MSSISRWPVLVHLMVYWCLVPTKASCWSSSLSRWTFLLGRSGIVHFQILSRPHLSTSKSTCVFSQACTSASCVSVVRANSRSVLAICISHDRVPKPVVKSDDKVSKSAPKSKSEDEWVGTIAACGEDCAITVVKILASGSLQISHILQVIQIFRYPTYFRWGNEWSVNLSAEVTVSKSQNLAVTDEKQRRLAAD